MKKYDLLLEIYLNTDLTNKEEVQNHLKEDEKTIEEWLDETNDAVDDAIEGLWESASDQFHSQVRRWYESGDYHNHTIPEGVNREEFGKLVLSQVSRRFRKCVETNT